LNSIAPACVKTVEKRCQNRCTRCSSVRFLSFAVRVFAIQQRNQPSSISASHEPTVLLSWIVEQVWERSMSYLRPHQPLDSRIAPYAQSHMGYLWLVAGTEASRMNRSRGLKNTICVALIPLLLVFACTTSTQALKARPRTRTPVGPKRTSQNGALHTHLHCTHTCPALRSSAGECR